MTAARSVLVMVAMTLALAGRATAAPQLTTQQLADRIVDWADEGCDYLKGIKRRPNKPLDDGSKRQAAHFGRIRGQEPRGEGTEYKLSISLFPGWEARYWLQSVTLNPSLAESLALAHFEKRLGKGQGTPTADGATDFAFPAGPGHIGCDVTITIAADKRVSGFKFARPAAPQP
jgi:hypothetical protein